MTKKLDIPSREDLHSKYWSQELSTWSIAKLYGVSQPTICRWLKKRTIRRRPSGGGHGHRRRYAIDSVISFLTTPSKNLYYVLGFTAADGCVSYRPHGYSVLFLHSKDPDHLRSIAKAMNYHKLPVYQKPTVYVLTICSKAVCELCIGYGITPRKSLTMKFPESIPEAYLSDFVRGYFDGDGCVEFKNWPKRYLPTGGISFVSGSAQFLKGLASILRAQGITPVHVRQTARGHTVLVFAERQCVLKFFQFIYRPAPELFMERKWKRASMVLGAYGYWRPTDLKQ